MGVLGHGFKENGGIPSAVLPLRPVDCGFNPNQACKKFLLSFLAASHLLLEDLEFAPSSSFCHNSTSATCFG